MTGEAETAAPVTDSFIKIPAAGGRVLSAHLWRPETPGRYPVILEFSPYRVWDVFRSLGETTFPYWAAHGYVVIAVDIAGSGASSGLLHDEYLKSEFDDAVAAMEWCAVQDWCDGSIGLTGGSWPAFTALRVSDRKPALLKAMVLGGVSEDGWRTDIHHLGGISYTGHVDWSGVMQMFNALPPDPKQFGDGWRDAWKARLDANRPWIEAWLAHPRHDAFWQDKAAKLTGDVPLLLYAGFADKYATSVLRIAERWQAPVRTILGPWEHMFPSLAARKPRIDFLKEALRWWDMWLKGRDSGAMNEAPLRAWVGAPDNQGKVEQGHWRALDWPAENEQSLVLHERNGVLVADDAGQADWQLLTSETPPAVNLTADLYEDVPAMIDLDGFARAGALVASAACQERDLDIAGVPVLRCRVRCSASGGQVVARLIDTSPSGVSVRMAIGALDLTRLGPGEEVEIAVPFLACAWRLKRTHRIELVLCADGSPTLWPAPRGVAVDVRDIRLSLPALPAAYKDEARFVPPAAAAASQMEKLKWIDRREEGIVFPRLELPAATHEAVSAAYHLPATGTDYYIASRFEIANAGDGQAQVAKSYRVAFERPGFSIRIDTRLEVLSTADQYRIAWTIRAFDNGAPFHAIDGASNVARP